MPVYEGVKHIREKRGGEKQKIAIDCENPTSVIAFVGKAAMKVGANK